MTANSFKTMVTALLILLSTNNYFANPKYKMTIENLTVVASDKVSADVYLENIGEAFELTSYECALSINQEIDLSTLTFEYVEGSSELKNKPNYVLGKYNLDGSTELGIVSFIGHDIINGRKLVGKFTLSGKIDISNVNILGIDWNFDGAVSTILTGINFTDITYYKGHKALFGKNEEDTTTTEYVKTEIVAAEASASLNENFGPHRLFDGITSESLQGNYNAGTEGRWATKGFPQWVTLDLGSEKTINHVMIDAFGSENGITYDCKFYSGNYDNKSLISTEKTQENTNWSKHSLNNVKTRYLTIEITGSKGNNYTDLWEVEVYEDTTSKIKTDDHTAINDFAEKNIPTEFGISQNYPNPFNPSTKIQVNMKERGNATVEVYNLLGERVMKVLDSELSAGTHEVTIDGSQLASGIYIYRLAVNNNFIQTRKMNLIK
ncbi:MAG: hypothetical protein CR986_07955 [Ignavibacteriae bacterium]|nr:MAG: hypothetical protein CR986_07955 [Ignavibacteriota bacterium]